MSDAKPVSKTETVKEKARRIAAEIATETHQKTPFPSEDDMIEYRRELQSDLEAGWGHRYY